jgi:hypothetical protein
MIPIIAASDDLGKGLSGGPNDGFKVSLAHTPEMYEEAQAVGVHLYLCGHTHGGQIRLPKPFPDRGQHVGAGVTEDCAVTPSQESALLSSLCGTTLSRR